jgi:secretion/DNA translocation related TadE-like protein
MKRVCAGRDREGGRDRGSGSILAVAIMAAMLGIVSLLVPLYAVLFAKQQAAGAADAAALAAADVAIGIVAGQPCGVAASLAAANGASLARCEVDGVIVTVTVSVPAFGFEVFGAATAGPPVSGDRFDRVPRVVAAPLPPASNGSARCFCVYGVPVGARITLAANVVRPSLGDRMLGEVLFCHEYRE